MHCLTRGVCFLGSLISLVATSGRAWAQSPDPGNDKQGSFFAVGLGAGYYGGAYELPALDSDRVLHGAEFLVEGALGYGVVRGLALAASGELGIGPSPARGTQAGGTVDAVYLAKLGLLAEFYPLEKTHFLLGAGLTHAGFAHSSDEAGEGVVGNSMSGPHFEAGIGYRVGPRLDLSARVGYAVLSIGDNRFRPIDVTIFLSWIRF
jgi:hypothetical protein